MRLQQLVGFVVLTAEDAVGSSGGPPAIDQLGDDFSLVIGGKSKAARFQNQQGWISFGCLIDHQYPHLLVCMG